MDWAKLPRELRERAQWCIAAAPGMYSEKGKEPLSVRADGHFYFSSVVEPSTWLPFDVAASHAWPRGLHIGFVLTADDPFACIDFDIKDSVNAPGKEETWTTRETYEFYIDCMRRFDSYTEHSASGKGFHLWVKGNIGRGVRARGIEIYSQERFIISTGDITHPRPIEYREPQLLAFAEYIRPKEVGDDIVLVEVDQEVDDWYIEIIGQTADNGDKFYQLWKGDWETMGYPSQSEADLALLSMLTFYSPSNKQVRRLFRESGLGQREKARKNDDYINRTLRTIRAREARERAVNISAMVQSADFVARYEQEQLIKAELNRLQGNANPIEVQPLHVAGLHIPPQVLPNTAAALAVAAPLPRAVVAAGEQGIAWPPGVAGRISQFVYQSAPRPVKEVAIVSAIGLLAGICGKGWHIPQSGLNMYVTLIAQSGVGKEAMHSGISAIVKAVNQINPVFYNFVNFNDFASGPALQKGCATSPSFVHVSGEWGKKLKRMADAEGGRDQSMTTLRTIMTNLYQKSGPQAIVGGIQYSQTDNNISSVSGVAYSMIGETTPGTFYEALTDDMMADGFLSRFLNIEYTGIRPSANPNQIVIPDAALIEVLSNLATAANRVVTATQPSIAVNRDERAAKLMADFEHECDSEINRSKAESYRQMWNRASLKSMRLAGLLAVADHHLYPCINEGHSIWSIDIVRRDIAIMQRHIEIGDIGMNDTTREKKLISVIRRYLTTELTPSQQDCQILKKNGVIPRKYIQIYATQSAAFSKARNGTVNALNGALASLLDNGYITEVPKDRAAKNYQFHGKCYQIINLPEDFGGEN